MAEIDMIPREYRDGVRVRHTLRRTGIALAAVVLLALAAGAGLRWRSAALERAAGALQASTMQEQAEAERGSALRAERARREREDAVLRALRREGELAALAQHLDTALSDQVWLTGLQIERDIQAAAAGATASATAEGGVEQLAGGTDAPVWRLRSSLQLSGQAENYQAVTAFLAALGRQPGITDLKLVSSAAATDGGAIDFRAAGTLTRPRTAP